GVAVPPSLPIFPYTPPFRSVYFMHGFDALTPVEEPLRTLDELVRSGKVGYIGASNFSGWHLMKSLAASDREGLNRYVAYQGYYSDRKSTRLNSSHVKNSYAV